MTTLRQAAENFLNSYLALVNSGDCGNWDPETEAEVIALRQALAESRSSELQEPPQRQWVGLTDGEIFECENNTPDEVISDREYCIYFARAIEAKLKEKNT